MDVSTAILLRVRLSNFMSAAGVDYLHPDLGGGFGPGYRVITGYDFVGDEGPCQ